MTEAYPLQWPAGRPRTPAHLRKLGSFSKKVSNGRWAEKVELTIADAMRRLQDELDRLGALNFVLSANLQRNLDGSPRSQQSAPADPGVALYFQLKGKPHCLPCDRYTRVQQNIAALAAHIEATRAIERYGVAHIAQMFAGFVALPGRTPWWTILGVHEGASSDQINAAYREKAKKAHVDSGGSDAAMSELNVARDEAMRARATA